MKKGGIYGIQNKLNGKWYIGQTTDIHTRKNEHFSRLKHNKHTNKHLQSAFNKYGLNNFDFHILEEIEEELLDVQECFWIDFYKSDQEQFGYNLESGGHANKHLSPKTRLKISISNRGKKSCWLNKHLTEEHRKRISESLTGKKGRITSMETRTKMSLSHGGNGTTKIYQKVLNKKSRFFSPEHRRKLCEARKGKTPNKGKTLSIKWRNNISKAIIGMKFKHSEKWLNKKT